MWLFYICVWFLGARALAIRGPNATSLPFTVDDTGFPSSVLPRIGSGPGWYDERFQLCLNCSDLVLDDDPGLKSATARETTQGVFRDVFYWPETFSVQDAAVGAENRIGFASGSDLYKQFKWIEVCPRHKKIVLHKQGDASDVTNHACGYNQKMKVNSSSCGSLDAVGCIFHGHKLGFFDGSQETHTCTNLETLDGPLREQVPVLDQTVNLYEKQWYAVYDGDAGEVALYPEYVANHTHSWQAFLALEMHLIYYVHFISDVHKDPSCTWTRVPLLFGSATAIVTTAFTYAEINVPARIFVIDSFLRNLPGLGAACMLSALVSAVLAVAITFYVYFSFRDTNALKENNDLIKACKFHLTVFYEMALCIPLTLLLLGGGRDNLLNLFFLFTLTLVTVGTRVRDIVRLFKAENKPTFQNAVKNQPVRKNVFITLYVLEGTITTIYVLLAAPAVWKTALDKIFLFSPIPVWSTACFIVLFSVYVFRYTYEHKAYYELEESWSPEKPCPIPFEIPTVKPQITLRTRSIVRNTDPAQKSAHFKFL